MRRCAHAQSRTLDHPLYDEQFDGLRFRTCSGRTTRWSRSFSALS